MASFFQALLRLLSPKTRLVRKMGRQQARYRPALHDLEERIVLSGVPPLIQGPSGQLVNPGGCLLFSQANGNAIQVQDGNAGATSLMVNLRALNSTLAVSMGYSTSIVGAGT